MEAAAAIPVLNPASGRQCLECGAGIPKGSRADFCSTPCRKVFHNRRMMRGAELYDLFMALRFDRKRATEMKVWRLLNRMASDFRAEDVRERGGRKSFGDIRDVLDRHPELNSIVIHAKTWNRPNVK